MNAECQTHCQTFGRLLAALGVADGGGSPYGTLATERKQRPVLSNPGSPAVADSWAAGASVKPSEAENG